MIIKIEIEKRIIKIVLLNDDNVVDSFEFEEKNNLSDTLLSEIDNIIVKNKIDLKDIEKMELEADVTESYTTFRIAKTTMDVFNWTKEIR